MSQPVRISIITPSFNQGEFLEETLRSVIDQGYSHLEYIVVDGGSNDGSVEIIQRYAGQLASWVSEPDDGQSDAINKGFANSTGDIIAWLNSDDTLLPGTLEFVAKYFSENPDVDCFFGDTICIDQFSRELLRRHELAFDAAIVTFAMNYVPQSSTFWRRRVYEKIGGLENHLHYTMDHEYWLRMHAGGFAIRYVPMFLSCYRWHEQSKGNINSRKIRTEHEQLIAIYGGLRSPLLRTLLRVPLKTFFRLKRQAIKVFTYQRCEFLPAHFYRWYLKTIKGHFAEKRINRGTVN